MPVPVPVPVPATNYSSNSNVGNTFISIKNNAVSDTQVANISNINDIFNNRDTKQPACIFFWRFARFARKKKRINDPLYQAMFGFNPGAC